MTVWLITELDRRHCQWDLDLNKRLDLCCPKRGRSLVDAGWHLADTKVGEAYYRWQRINNGRENRAGRAQAKQGRMQGLGR